LKDPYFIKCCTLQLLIDTKLEIDGVSAGELESLQTIAYERLAACEDLGGRIIKLWRQFIEGMMERAGYQSRQTCSENLDRPEE
jgi:hypothetical protein